MLNDKPLVICWGGGVNSTAVLIGLYLRRITPDLILFANTKAEKPETYTFKVELDSWLFSIGFPSITTVSKEGKKDTSLEQACLRLGLLPSIAYGYKTCSMRWKKEPQDKFSNSFQLFQDAWAAGSKVIKAIGFDTGESHRAKYTEDEKYLLWYPLIEWNWGRAECMDIIRNMGLSIPVKSSCFFCPSSKKHEIVHLRSTYPDLFQRAVNIERKALSGEGEGTFKTTRTKGLGRSFSWETLIGVETVETDCMCFDGEEE